MNNPGYVLLSVVPGDTFHWRECYKSFGGFNLLKGGRGTNQTCPLWLSAVTSSVCVYLHKARARDAAVLPAAVHPELGVQGLGTKMELVQSCWPSSCFVTPGTCISLPKQCLLTYSVVCNI